MSKSYSDIRAEIAKLEEQAKALYEVERAKQLNVIAETFTNIAAKLEEFDLTWAEVLPEAAKKEIKGLKSSPVSKKASKPSEPGQAPKMPRYKGRIYILPNGDEWHDSARAKPNPEVYAIFLKEGEEGLNRIAKPV